MDSLFSQFTSFEKLIATKLIKILYWIGLVFIILGTIAAMFSGFANGFGSGIISFIVAPIAGFIGLLFWRFLCEVYIVVFGMYERLGNIQDRLGPAQS